MTNTDMKNILLSGYKTLAAGEILLASTNVNTYDERDQKNYFSNALFIDIDETNSSAVTTVEVFLKLLSPGAFYNTKNNPGTLDLPLFTIDMTGNIKSQLITFGGFGSIFPGAIFNDYVISVKNTAGSLIVNNIWVTLKK